MNELTRTALPGDGRGVGNRKLIILVVAVLAERAFRLVETLFG